MTIEEIKRIKARMDALECLDKNIRQLQLTLKVLKARPDTLTVGSTRGSTIKIEPPIEISKKIILMLEDYLTKLQKEFDEA